jgi:hypothetical protein
MTRTLLAALALACALFSHAQAVDSDGSRPDDQITPGEIRSTDKVEICGHTTAEFRDVSATTKIAARRAYGLMSPKAGWCAAEDGCEIDHRVPLTVGGGNTPGSIKNLWPQRPDGPMGFHVKDRCEAAVGRAICDGTLTVEQAQAIFLGDWVAGCAASMGGLVR